MFLETHDLKICYKINLPYSSIHLPTYHNAFIAFIKVGVSSQGQGIFKTFQVQSKGGDAIANVGWKTSQLASVLPTEGRRDPTVSVEFH